MTYTTTEERTFKGACDHPALTTAIITANKRLHDGAEKKGFEHEVKETFQITVKRADKGDEVRYLAEASATFAKIVPAEWDETPDEPPAGVIDSVPTTPILTPVPARPADDPFEF
jgi:hypothetical protein